MIAKRVSEPYGITGAHEDDNSKTELSRSQITSKEARYVGLPFWTGVVKD